jgi:hypothetical protein
MSDFIPAGRLSAVDHGDQKIAIQTEFSKCPEPRIATTVSIGGRTIHKIQKLWGKTIDSLDEVRQVEELINKQHDEVTALVHEHAGTLIRHSEKDQATSVAHSTIEQVEKLPAVESVIQHSVNDQATSVTHLTIEQVEKIPTIESAFIILPDGKVVARNRVSKEAEMLAAMIHSLTDVLFDMARVGNLGDCEDCVLNLGTRDVLLLPFKGGYLVALTDTKTRKREIFAELWKIARAA